MKKKLFACAASAVLFAGIAGAQTNGNQLTSNAEEEIAEELQEAAVSAVRAPKDAPYAVSNISGDKTREHAASGRELPLLFARTPGVIAWSENGVGTGTTYMRIRGAGGSRINVTLDGVPLNSPEDQTVFWANMNSYGKMLGSVQILRGVGSSTNGDGAFGGTISLGSRAPSLVPTAEISTAFGSWNTFHAGGSISTGLLWQHLVIDGAYNETSTDGYMHGTDGRSGSYTAGASWIGNGWKLSYRLFGNFENTGQAWNGVTAGNGDLSIMDGSYCDASWAYNQHTGIKTYKDICEAGLGRYNSLYEYLLTDDNGIFIQENGKFKYARYEMNDGTLWPRTRDYFMQSRHILNFSGRLSDALRLSATIHYTGGYGYYDEFRQMNKLVKYGISDFTASNGRVIKKSDFVRRKGLDQDCSGAIANLFYDKGRWEAVAGLSLQHFESDHFGWLRYAGISATEAAASPEKAAAYKEFTEDLLKDGKYRYYSSPAIKNDASAFAKASFSISDKWSVFADLQLRHILYTSGGYNDKYYDNGDGTASRHQLDISESWTFFNPKAGVNFKSGAHRAYASIAVGNREPERNNFTDNGKYPAPRAERLFDFEAGYGITRDIWRASAGIYYMKYKDQLVQTGELSDIGEALTTNIADSYRAGLELSAGIDFCSWFSLEGNAALSANRVLDFDEYVEDWDHGVKVIHYDSTPLAYSPSAICNAFADFHFGGFSAVWHSSFVSRMYLDNSGNTDRSLPAYSLSDLSLNYRIRPAEIRARAGKSRRGFLKEATAGVDFSNIFSAKVAQSGWVYSAVYESAGHGNDNRYYQLGFIPVAPFTVTARIAFKF